jgi:Flp pilus assembly protein TadG
MKVRLRPRLLRVTCLRRALGDTRGAAALEFGLVSLPFLALLGAIIQVAFVIWAEQNFDFAFQKAARTLFTGQFQQNNSQTGTSAALLSALQSSMCGSGVVLFNCSAVKIDVSLGTSSGSSFAGTTAPSPVDPTTRDWAAGFGTHYACAGPGTIVIATAAVKFPIIFGLLNAGLSNFADGSKLLESTAVFKTEPYSSGASPCSGS